MATRKRQSEFGLNMQMQYKAICRLSELDYHTSTNFFNEDRPCHLYFIGSRPKITIDKNGFSFNENIFTIRLNAQIEDNFQWLEMDFENVRKSMNLRLETTFPYFSFKLYDADELLLHSNGIRLMADGGLEKRTSFYKNLDFKILYVGQSYGVEGARTAPDRLKSHSTM